MKFRYYIKLAISVVWLISMMMLGLAACSSDDDEGENRQPINGFLGTWSADFGDYAEIGEEYKTIFTTNSDGTYTSDDYVDKEGYGIYLYKGTCNNKWEVYELNGKINLKFEISSSLSNYPSTLCNIGPVKDIEENSYLAFNYANRCWVTVNRFLPSRKNGILGYWQFESVSGTYVDINGSTHPASDGSWTIKCLYFSDSEIKGQKGYNGIIFHNTTRKYPEFVKYSYDNSQIFITSLSGEIIVDNLTETELTLLYKGVDGNKNLDLKLVYKRVPTFDNR